MNYHIKYLVESFIDDEEESYDIELTDGGRAKRYLDGERQQIIKEFCANSVCFKDDSFNSTTIKIRNTKDDLYYGYIIEYYEDIEEYHDIKPDIIFRFHENSKNIMHIYIKEFIYYPMGIITDFLLAYYIINEKYGITIDNVSFITRNLMDFEKMMNLKFDDNDPTTPMPTINSNLIKILPNFYRICANASKEFNTFNIEKCKFDSFETLYDLAIKLDNTGSFVNLYLDYIRIQGKKFGEWDKILSKEQIDYLVGLPDISKDGILTIKYFKPM